MYSITSTKHCNGQTDDACAGHLVGQVDFVWASAVLHVLSRGDCEKFLRNVNLLLKPGGSVYGWTVGNAEPREWADTPDGKQKRYLHSPVSHTAQAHFCMRNCMHCQVCS